MKHTTAGIALLLASALAVATTSSTAEARPRPSKKAKKFQANKSFGLGIMLGAPTGLSGKYFYAPDKAFDFGVGAIGYYRGRNGFHLHFDHLWHPLSLASTPAFELPLYLGVGARIFDFDDRDDFHGSAIGVRGPIGIAFDLNNVPMDIFFELALVVDFFARYDCNGCSNIGVDVNGAIGFRYYFN
ncbi:MAG: hypothetical protein HS111_39330 [Kofleriaceae bacterium]|nr:hypothetical protein [Kofleriaceae bacterium]MCL4226885.1 hypothetical protein [Myxococcales bacterium]